MTHKYAGKGYTNSHGEEGQKKKEALGPGSTSASKDLQESAHCEAPGPGDLSLQGPSSQIYAIRLQKLNFSSESE